MVIFGRNTGISQKLPGNGLLEYHCCLSVLSSYQHLSLFCEIVKPVFTYIFYSFSQPDF